MDAPRYAFDETDSTNTQLKRLAEQGAPNWTVVTAKTQTAGYGQRERSWVSEAGKGLYASVLLPVTGVATQLPFLVGLACRDALSAWSDEVQLKWVNDLVARKHKLGGILLEGVRAGAVAGIGINLAPVDLPEAIALSDLSPIVPSTEALLDAVLASLQSRMAQWRTEGFEPLRRDWEAASVTLGRRVRVTAVTPEVEGLATGLGPSGELLLRLDDGSMQPIVSGTLRTPEGAYC